MATLKELRFWARGREVAGLPARRFKLGFVERVRAKHGVQGDEQAKQKPRGKGRYKCSAEGDDAIILFGKHRGKRLSDIVKEDRSYLEFILREEFGDDLKDVAKFLLEKTKS